MNKVNYVKKHPLLKFERHGDLIDLQYLGLDKVFKATYRDSSGLSCKLDEDGAIMYEAGDIFRVKLGFSMKLPQGKKAQVFMRSGTRKNFNVRLTNHTGQIDNNYGGTNDEWLAEFEALDNGFMELGDRILQFEIVDAQPEWDFVEVEELENVDRGGFSSTGK